MLPLILKQNSASSFVKCTLLERKGGLFKDKPAGSLSNMFKSLSANMISHSCNYSSNLQCSASEVEPGYKSEENTNAPFGATQDTAFYCVSAFVVTV